MKNINYYKLLGVSPKATPNEIKIAAKPMLMDKTLSREERSLIQKAAMILSDPIEKRKYDKQRFREITNDNIKKVNPSFEEAPTWIRTTSWCFVGIWLLLALIGFVTDEKKFNSTDLLFLPLVLIFVLAFWYGFIYGTLRLFYWLYKQSKKQSVAMAQRAAKSLENTTKQVIKKADNIYYEAKLEALNENLDKVQKMIQAKEKIKNLEKILKEDKKC